MLELIKIRGKLIKLEIEKQYESNETKVSTLKRSRKFTNKTERCKLQEPKMKEGAPLMTTQKYKGL